MTDWEFFMSITKGYKPYFRRPKIVILEGRNDYLEKYPDAWAYFDGSERTTYILREYNNFAVRMHEYGHWINMCIYFLMEIAWEFLWWGTGLRKIFKRRGIMERIRS